MIQLRSSLWNYISSFILNDFDKLLRILKGNIFFNEYTLFVLYNKHSFIQTLNNQYFIMKISKLNWLQTFYDQHICDICNDTNRTICCICPDNLAAFISIFECKESEIFTINASFILVNGKIYKIILKKTVETCTRDFYSSEIIYTSHNFHNFFSFLKKIISNCGISFIPYYVLMFLKQKLNFQY